MGGVGAGNNVVLLFVGLSSATLSAARVAMRVSQGGHDVPAEKLAKRFPRTLTNLQLGIERLPHVVVYDNSDLANSFRLLALFENSSIVQIGKPIPKWLRSVLREL